MPSVSNGVGVSKRYSTPEIAYVKGPQVTSFNHVKWLPIGEFQIFLYLFKMCMTLNDVKTALFSKLFIYLSVNGILMIISRSK